MSALRWLWIAAILASMYVTYLVIGTFDPKIWLPPGRLNAAVLLLFFGGFLTIGLNELNARRHVAECARLDHMDTYLDRIDRRLDAIDQGRPERAALSGDITRDLSRPRGTVHFSRIVAQLGMVPATGATQRSLPEATAGPDTTFLENAAEYYELGRQAGLASRDDEDPTMS